MARYQTFSFGGAEYDPESSVVSLHYSYQGGPSFTETAVLPRTSHDYEDRVLQAALNLLLVVCGTSYYKAFVAPEFECSGLELSEQDAAFFNDLYRGGLSQMLYENGLHPDELARFEANADKQPPEAHINPENTLLMLSGGKDSLLAATLLNQRDAPFTGWYLSSTGSYPPVVEQAGGKPLVVKRNIDLRALKQADYNGHVPFSAILAGYALVSAIVSGHGSVLAANESSADQANVEIDGWQVNHQYSKTFGVEQGMQAYIERNIAKGLRYGSLLRRYNELEIAEMFAEQAWSEFGDQFSSCNRANYKQGSDGKKLQWCGECSKCANAFLLFAPFVDYDELVSIFGGKNLLGDKSLEEVYRQLMGLSSIKPFECVGTFEELRHAYWQAAARDKRYHIPGIEPHPLALQPSRHEQTWVGKMLS